MSRLAVDLARCLSPVEFCRSIGMEPDPWQQSVLESQHPRIVLNIARQLGKSQTCAVKAAHVAIFEPGSLVLLLSPSQRQSGELFKKVTAVVKALDQPTPTDAESATTLQLSNGSRIVSLPGAESTIRAYSSVRLLICDEASRIPDETLAACRPFLAVSGGQLIALSTPAGARGWYWDAFVHGGPTWERYEQKAASCSRITAEFLEEERRSLGDYFFRQEYECDWLSSETAAFDAAWLETLINEELELWNL